jgi:hypothetical protein
VSITKASEGSVIVNYDEGRVRHDRWQSVEFEAHRARYFRVVFWGVSGELALAELQATGYVLNALRPEAEHPSIALRVAGGRDGEFAVNGRGVRVARRRFRGTPDYNESAALLHTSTDWTLIATQLLRDPI